MTVDDGSWNPHAAAAACPVVSWRGAAWRFHRRVWPADDPTGSLKAPSRWILGWPALYLTLRSHIAFGEVTRHLTPDHLSRLQDHYRLTEFRVEVQNVLDCCADKERKESAIPGLSTDDVCRVNAFQRETPAPSQLLAAVAFERGFEGLLVPSCTRFAGGNLVLFSTNLLPGSKVRIVRAEDPVLYVERSGV